MNGEQKIDLANDYQKLAARTLLKRPDFRITDEQVMIVWNALGLAGEAGEVCDHIKRAIFHQAGLDIEHLKKELGDCLWYLTALCSEIDLNLSDIMEANIEKLKKRYPNGYNPQDSKARADGEPLL